MPIPPRILDDIQKQRYLGNNNPVDMVEGRDNLSYQLFCPKCDILMVKFIDPKTRQAAGLICPQCERRLMPGMNYSQDGISGKKKKQMTTVKDTVSKEDNVGRRDTEAIIPTLRESLYKADESAVDTFKKLKYAGKEKKQDPDEALLKAHGMTILESKEINPK